MARRLHRWPGLIPRREVHPVPQVASKASVLKPQHSGLTQRERMSEPKDSTSPFSLLLAETGSEAAPAGHHSSRPNGTAGTQRTEPPHNRNVAERPQQTVEEAAADASEASTSEAAATGQADGAAVESFEIAAAGQAAAPPELSPQPAAGTGDADDEEVVTIDAALAASVETPPPPTPAVPDAPAPAVAVTPAAPVPTDPGTVESTAAAGVTAAAPAADIAPVTPDAVGAAEPELPPAPQAAAVPQTAQAPEQAAQQQVTAPAPPQARPPSVEPAATHESVESSNQPQPSAAPETAAPVAPVAGSEHAETKSAAEKPVPTETPFSPPARPNGPETAERPQTASAVSEFIQAAQQPTPDGSQLAQLQTGRDFGQAVAAAHASQDADASNPLTTAPVPLESLAVEIATRAQGGRNRFEIRLDPPELGRIDVRLDIDRSGNVTSRLVVEKAETLDVLRRDAHQLERALQDAGLKTSDNGMQFSLRDQAFADRNNRDGSSNPRILIADPELPAAEGAAVAYGLTLRGGSGIDIRV